MLKLVCLIEVSSKFVQENQQYSYFYYILLFQFGLINDQPNAFFISSIGVNYIRVNFARIKYI